MFAFKWRNRQRNTCSPLVVALTMSLCAQNSLVGPAQALPFIAAKKPQVHVPMESKLDDAAGPSADTESREATKDTNNKSDETNLAPLTLTEDAKGSAGKTQPASESGAQFLKLHAETVSVTQKGPLDGDSESKPTTLPSKSLKGELGAGKGKLIDQANKVNVRPLSLQYSEAETEQKTITELDCERAQISELWEATLNRNQDIQFVVQKLMPNSDKGRTTTMLMRLISMTLSTAVSTTAVVNPTPGGYATSQVASNAIMSVINTVDSKQRGRESLDEGQAISLYMMVRGTADKVTENYRDYKKFVRKIDRSENRTEKLQNMIADTRSRQDDIRQFEMEYWIDRSQGDVEEAVADARRYRQSLIDLAGGEAVTKLDLALNEQLIAEQNGVLDKGPLLPGQRLKPETKNDAKATAKPKFTPEQERAFYKLLETQGRTKQASVD